MFNFKNFFQIRKMSASEDESSEAPSNDQASVAFVKLLNKYPVLLNKSQIPSIKEAKGKAVTAFLTECNTLEGMALDKKALFKRINNMKSRTKGKADKSRTGNKPIKLLGWEKEFLELLQADSNPVFAKIPVKQTTNHTNIVFTFIFIYFRAQFQLQPRSPHSANTEIFTGFLKELPVPRPLLFHRHLNQTN